MRVLNSLVSLGLVSVLLIATAATAEEIYTTARGGNVAALGVFRECDLCPEMVVLPTGSFTMGSSEQEADAAHRRFFSSQNIDPDEADAAAREYLRSRDIDPDKDPAAWLNPFLSELPAHRVAIDLPVAMGRTEVTRAQWAACVEEGGCARGLKDKPSAVWGGCLDSENCELTPDDRIRFRHPEGPFPSDPLAPRTAVTYQEMLDYTAWLNGKVGADVYRIPTEAEWEYAARAGTSTEFAQGHRLGLEQANFLVVRRESVNGEYVWNYDLGSVNALVSVDSLDAANGWGLRHMSGNASEMTSNCGAGGHRALATSSQYLAVDARIQSCDRVRKGGMYHGNVELARPARRVALTQEHWSPSGGFRVLRDLDVAIGAVEKASP